MEDMLRSEMDVVRRAVDEELRRIKAAERFPPDLYDAAFHLPLSGGKRIRPMLVIKAAQLFGVPFEDALPVGVAVEILHNFTLIHDDLMDRDEFRRGVPTTHVAWGEPIAIAAGDVLFALIYLYVTRETSLRDFEPAVSLRVVKALSESAEEICRGQVMDVMGEKYVSSESEYLDMVARKTSALIGVSCTLGGLIGGASEAEMKALQGFGRNIGICFQIVDDVMGAVGDPDIMGKPVGSDLKQGKRTIILIHSLQNALDMDRERILSVFGDEDADQEEVRRVTELLVALGSVDHARKLAQTYMEEALKHLRRLPENRHRDVLEALAHFIYARKM